MATSPQIVVDIAVTQLAEKCKPFQHIPRMWNHTGESWDNPILEDEIRFAIGAGSFRPELTCGTRTQHVERIAHLANTGWDVPLMIRVSLPTADAPGDWDLIDGYHRLHAAVIRGDATIQIKLYNLCRWYLTPSDREWLASVFPSLTLS
jgi:hypothetical protein